MFTVGTKSAGGLIQMDKYQYYSKCVYIYIATLPVLIGTVCLNVTLFLWQKDTCAWEFVWGLHFGTVTMLMMMAMKEKQRNALWAEPTNKLNEWIINTQLYNDDIWEFGNERRQVGFNPTWILIKKKCDFGFSLED